MMRDVVPVSRSTHNYRVFGKGRHKHIFDNTHVSMIVTVILLCNRSITMYFAYQDEELARQLVELGYRGSGEVLKREEFEAKKQAAAASKLARRDQQK